MFYMRNIENLVSNVYSYLEACVEQFSSPPGLQNLQNLTVLLLSLINNKCDIMNFSLNCNCIL